MTLASDIIGRARITDVWTSLGGAPLRHGRGRAWWREGDGWNVSLNDRKGTWFDHARGEGGGIIDLIVSVRGDSRADAMAWLADLVGVTLESVTPEKRRQWRRERDELREADLWARSAEALAEMLLETEALDGRAALTRVISVTRQYGPVLREEYRAWRETTPDLTVAMVEAGRLANLRIQKALACQVTEWGARHVTT